MSRTKKSFYNIITQASNEIIATICILILPRLIISHFGSGYYGLVASINQFLDYISILTLGIAGSTRVALYKTIASGDILASSAVLKSHKMYMRKVGIAFVGYTMVLTIVFPFIQRSSFSWVDVACLVLIISISTMTEYFFGITAKTFLMANQCHYIFTLINIITKVLSTVTCIAIIILGGSVHMVYLGSSIILAFGPIALNRIVRRKFGIVEDVEPDDSAMKQRKDVAASSIANIIHGKVDVFLLTVFADIKVVSVYSIYYLVTSSLQKIQTIFTTGLEGAFGDLWARGEVVLFGKRLELFEYLIFSFVSVVFSCAGILILPFVTLYTKGVTDINYIIPAFAFTSVLATAFFSLRSPYLTAVQAAGKYKETKNGAIMEAIINLVISTIGVLTIGIVGVAIGTLCANVFRTIQYSLFTSKYLIHRKYTVIIKRFIWTCLNVTVIVGSYCIIPIPFSLDSWKSWVGFAIVIFIFASFITIINSLLFYKDDLKNSAILMKKMIYKL